MFDFKNYKKKMSEVPDLPSMDFDGRIINIKVLSDADIRITFRDELYGINPPMSTLVILNFKEAREMAKYILDVLGDCNA